MRPEIKGLLAENTCAQHRARKQKVDLWAANPRSVQVRNWRGWDVANRSGQMRTGSQMPRSHVCKGQWTESLYMLLDRGLSPGQGFSCPGFVLEETLAADAAPRFEHHLSLSGSRLTCLQTRLRGHDLVGAGAAFRPAPRQTQQWLDPIARPNRDGGSDACEDDVRKAPLRGAVGILSLPVSLEPHCAGNALGVLRKSWRRRRQAGREGCVVVRDFLLWLFEGGCGKGCVAAVSRRAMLGGGLGGGALGQSAQGFSSLLAWQGDQSVGKGQRGLLCEGSAVFLRGGVTLPACSRGCWSLRCP